jgi:signal transduction histidine kinase
MHAVQPDRRRLWRRRSTQEAVRIPSRVAPVLIILIAAALSLLAIAMPAARLRLDSPVGGAIVVTARGMAELFVAFLAGQRFGRTGSGVDFGTAVGLGVMGVADVAFSLGRATLAPNAVSTAAVLPYQAVGAALLVAAAFSPRRPLVRWARQRMTIAGVGVVALGLFILQGFGLIPGADLPSRSEPVGIVLIRIAVCALLATAAAGFARRSEHRRDPLIRWLAAAAALAALAQLQRVAIPAPLTAAFTWMHALQLGAAAALLVGCVGEMRDYRRRLAEMAVADERRRIARDLHDGLAQEVAFIASQSNYLARQSDDERLKLIAEAAQRALDDSRFVVGALTRTSGQPLGASLALQAQEFARRWGIKVQLALQDEVDVAPEEEHAILRIVAEALSNAARHADASTISIRLGDHDGRLRVAVSDDGRGFDAEAETDAQRGFGLRSMRERAQRVGGDVWLESEPGSGTRVEIAIH